MYSDINVPIHFFISSSTTMHTKSWSLFGWWPWAH